MNGYETVLARTGTIVILQDWTKSAFLYSPSVSQRLFGRYDERTFWRILLSDMVADAKTVRAMQQLVHDIANDRERMEGSTTAKLKTPSGKKHTFLMNVYKQVNEFGLTDKLILTLQDMDEKPAPSQAPRADAEQGLAKR